MASKLTIHVDSPRSTLLSQCSISSSPCSTSSPAVSGIDLTYPVRAINPIEARYNLNNPQQFPSISFGASSGDFTDIPQEPAPIRPRHTRSRSDDASSYARARFTDHITSPQDADISNRYILGDTLGSGMMGVVRRCSAIGGGVKAKQWACKTVSKAKLLSRDDVQLLIEEVEVMRKVARHNVMLKLHEVIEDAQEVHLICELCHGGDLFDRVASEPYSERDSAFVLRSLISAVHYMHHHGYMHRDIKPENVFLTRKNSNVSVRLGDFGQASRLIKGENLSLVCGSSYYVAPEVIDRSYNKEADIWSLGVLLYVLLSGHPPFGGKSHAKILEKIRTREADIQTGTWKNISEKAKDLVRRMLTKDPAQRITAAGIKKHPWILHHCPPVEACPSPASSTFSAYSYTSHATPPRSPWSASGRCPSKFILPAKSMSGEVPIVIVIHQTRRSSAEYSERDFRGLEKFEIQYPQALINGGTGSGKRHEVVHVSRQGVVSEFTTAPNLVPLERPTRVVPSRLRLDSGERKECESPNVRRIDFAKSAESVAV